MEEKKLEIFYDHYKDTFEIQKTYLQRRNNYSLIALLLLVVLSFQISNPEQTVQISNEIIKQHIGEISINFAFINSLLLFAFLWIIIMYFQINLIIDRYYKYIQDIEKKLSENLTPFEISREGKTYLKQYPWISYLVHRIYTIAFPLTLILVACVKWKAEINLYKENLCNGHFLFDSAIIFGLILLTVLYLTKVHFNDFKKKT